MARPEATRKTHVIDSLNMACETAAVAPCCAIKRSKVAEPTSSTPIAIVATVSAATSMALTATRAATDRILMVPPGGSRCRGR